MLWHLLPMKPLGQLVRVLSWSEQEKEKDRWKRHDARYHAQKALGHLKEYLNGQTQDPETGLPTLAHVGVRVLFALAKEDGDGKSARD